jgi:hypothetical protein
MRTCTAISCITTTYPRGTVTRRLTEIPCVVTAFSIITLLSCFVDAITTFIRSHRLTRTTTRITIQYIPIIALLNNAVTISGSVLHCAITTACENAVHRAPTICGRITKVTLLHTSHVPISNTIAAKVFILARRTAAIVIRKVAIITIFVVSSARSTIRTKWLNDVIPTFRNSTGIRTCITIICITIIAFLFCGSIKQTIATT